MTISSRKGKGTETAMGLAQEVTVADGRSMEHMNSIGKFDAENAASSSAREDPFSLQDGVKSEGELSELRKRKRGKKLEMFHRKQNDLIEYLLKPIDEHTQEAKNEEDDARLKVKIAIWASLAANLILCILQLYAAISAKSLSLIATGIDSVFDIGSNVLLVYIHRKSARLDLNKWPVGGARLESIGNIVYGFLMGAVNVIVIVESIRALISQEDSNEFQVASIAAVAAALGVKFLLFLYCYSLRKVSSQVEVLWEDHRNDLFINSFGVLMSAGGSKLRWWLDPMGAILIATGVVLLWGHTIYKQFELLAGKSAPHEFLQLIIYKASTFSEEIQQIDTVRAYHSGPDYFVEVDVVMPGDTPLWKAHDISQQLQDKIEALPNVERAFVHVDHETTHKPEHRKFV